MKKIKTLFLTLIMCFNVASAANTADTDFSFINTSMTSYTSARYKDDYTNFYVYPKSGPTIKYTVQGSDSVSPMSTWTDRSFQVSILTGTKASIYNRVKLHNESYARLKFVPLNYSPALTKGVWSPDCAGSYTVYGLGYTD